MSPWISQDPTDGQRPLKHYSAHADRKRIDVAIRIEATRSQSARWAVVLMAWSFLVAHPGVAFDTMKNLTCILLASLHLVSLRSFALATRWTRTHEADSDILSECKRLQPARHARVVEGIHDRGGLSHRIHRTFVHRHCPIIRAMLTLLFRPKAGDDGSPTL